MQSHQPGVARYMASPFRHRFTLPSLIGWRFLWLMLMSSGMLLSTAAVAVSDTWQDISASVQIDHSNPIRSRRSPDAKVTVEITNTSTQALSGPIRLVLDGLTPDTVSLSGASGTTASGAPYIDVSAYMGDTLDPGVTTSLMTLVIAGGGSATFSFNPIVERQQSNTSELSIDITEPNTLITVGSTPLQVSGTLSDANAALTINGIVVSHDGGGFSVAVSLEEGHNTIVARAVSAGGNEVTDSIVVSLDTTPPYITVDSPQDGDTLSTDSISVSGLINDIVRGTVSEGQANVTVNGVTASVANRSYLAQNISLTEGENEILISASDQVGNTAHNSIVVNYTPPAPKRIEYVSGQNQSAPIRSVLTNPLAVKLFDTDGVTPVANKNVIFRVIQGDGVVAPGTADESQAVLTSTDVNGIAQTSFRLGSRSGTGNHKVRARAVGFDSEVIFYASAEAKAGDKVSINSGNNQRGAINQPLPLPFIVAVTDEGANVVQGASVAFKVTQGSGQFQNGLDTIVATTDSDGRASAHLTLGEEAGLDIQRVTATLVGTSFTAGFTASGLVTGDPGQTQITGVVLDNQDTPLPGVTVRVDGTNRQASTDEQGQFTITEVPVGPVHLLVDGSTTSVSGEWPTLSYNIVTVSGAVNPLSAPIYMVKLDTENAVLAGSEEVTLTLPEVPGFELKVLANSVTFPDGSREGLISVTPVNASKVPMAPPNGMQPQFIVTIQPAGAMFDPPAPLTLPNVDGHAPGAQVEMYSYDHDLEEFVAIGLGTVSADGTVVRTNPGVGVIKAGWHCGSQPGGNGCTNNCSECKTCNDECNCDNDDSKTPRSITNTPNDCKQPACRGGRATELEDKDDQPSEICQICVGKTIADIGVEVTGVPEKICVGGTKTFSAKITPTEAAEKYGEPVGNVGVDAGSVSLSFREGDDEMTGVAAHADKTSLFFKPFDVPGGDACEVVTKDVLVLPRNIEGIPGKINRFTEHSFQQAECPNYPSQDERRNHDVDGCSGGIAQDPVNYGGLYIGYITGSQQFNRGVSTAFGESQGVIAHANVAAELTPLACNNHDICYQTCGETQSSCDLALKTDADNMCGRVYPPVCPNEFLATGQCAEYAEERELCFDLSSDTYDGLRAFGSPAFTQRQTQYCLCCGEQ